MSDVESSVRCDFLLEEFDEHLLVRAIGELDECSASALIGLADDLSNRSRRMVIDLAGVTLLGSAGVDGLMNLRDRLIELTLLNPSPTVRAVLKASGMAGSC